MRQALSIKISHTSNFIFVRSIRNVESYRPAPKESLKFFKNFFTSLVLTYCETWTCFDAKKKFFSYRERYKKTSFTVNKPRNVPWIKLHRLIHTLEESACCLSLLLKPSLSSQSLRGHSEEDQRTSHGIIPSIISWTSPL